MAQIIRESNETTFIDVYGVDNGEIGNASAINRSSIRNSIESYGLWDYMINPYGYVTGNLIITVGDTFINDDISIRTLDNKVRSVQGLHAENFDSGTW